MSIAEIYESGFVRRYHTNLQLGGFGQTNAAHQWGVALLITLMHPNPGRNLLIAALVHDAGEAFTGDLPSPFKQQYPSIAEEVSDLEKLWVYNAMDEELYTITEEDESWIKMCDGLEACLFNRAMKQKPPSEEWARHESRVLDMAESLGVREKAALVLYEVYYGKIKPQTLK